MIVDGCSRRLVSVCVLICIIVSCLILRFFSLICGHHERLDWVLIVTDVFFSQGSLRRQVYHLRAEQLVDSVLVLFSLLLARVTNASGEASILVIKWRRVAAFAQPADHLPATETVESLGIITTLQQQLVSVILRELAQVGLRARHTLRILDSWIEVHSDAHAVLVAVVRNLQRHLEERVAAVTI